MSVVYLIACWVAPQHHFHNGTTPKTRIASSQCKEHCAPYTVRPPHVKATLQNAIGYRDSIQTQDDTRSQQLLPLGARGQPRDNFPRPKNAVQTTCTPALSKPCIPYQLQFLAQMHNSKHSVPWLCRATADLQHAPQAPRVKWTAVAAAGRGLVISNASTLAVPAQQAVQHLQQAHAAWLRMTVGTRALGFGAGPPNPAL